MVPLEHAYLATPMLGRGACHGSTSPVKVDHARTRPHSNRPARGGRPRRRRGHDAPAGSSRPSGVSRSPLRQPSGVDVPAGQTLGELSDYVSRGFREPSDNPRKPSGRGKANDVASLRARSRGFRGFDPSATAWARARARRAGAPETLGTLRTLGLGLFSRRSSSEGLPEPSGTLGNPRDAARHGSGRDGLTRFREPGTGRKWTLRGLLEARREPSGGLG